MKLLRISPSMNNALSMVLTGTYSAHLFWGLRRVLLGAEGKMASWKALAFPLWQAERRFSSLWCLRELGRWSKNSSFSPRVWFIHTCSPSIGWICPVPWCQDLRTEDGNFWNRFVLFQTLLYSAELGKSQVALPNDILVQVVALLKLFYMKPHSFMLLEKLP